MKIILFEGADKVGKTTTISELIKDLKNAGYKPLLLKLPFEYSDSISNEEREYRLGMTVRILLDMSNYFKDDKYVCLIDRLHISERVFGDVLRNHYNKTLFNTIDITLKNMSCLLITVIPDTILGNFVKFKDKYSLIDGLTYHQYQSTAILFETEFYSSKIKDKYMVKTQNLNDVSIKVLKWLRGGM